MDSQTLSICSSIAERENVDCNIFNEEEKSFSEIENDNSDNLYLMQTTVDCTKSLNKKTRRGRPCKNDTPKRKKTHDCRVRDNIMVKIKRDFLSDSLLKYINESILRECGNNRYQKNKFRKINTKIVNDINQKHLYEFLNKSIGEVLSLELGAKYTAQDIYQNKKNIEILQKWEAKNNRSAFTNFFKMSVKDVYNEMFIKGNNLIKEKDNDKEVEVLTLDTLVKEEEKKMKKRLSHQQINEYCSKLKAIGNSFVDKCLGFCKKNVNMKENMAEHINSLNSNADSYVNRFSEITLSSCND